MKNKITPRIRVILVAAVVLALATVGLSLLFGGRANPVSNAISTVTGPLKSGMSTLVETAEDIYDYIFCYEMLQAENDQLRQQLADMNADIRTAQTYKEENQRLRELQGLAEKHTDYDMEIANVVSWGGSGYGSVMTISKGENAGLAAGMCAITESGQVVGLVTQTGKNWANVTTVLDTTSEIGAYIFGSGYTCIASGDFSLVDEGKFLASYLASSATIRNSDTLLTSGDGDIYPPGLVLGTVTDVGNDETNVAQYAIISPTVEIRDVEQVFVIKSYDIND